MYVRACICVHMYVDVHLHVYVSIYIYMYMSSIGSIQALMYAPCSCWVAG